MALGKLPVQRRPTYLDIKAGQVPIALAVGADGICLEIFLSFNFCHFFLSLWKTARYRLTYWSQTQNNQKSRFYFFIPFGHVNI